MEINTRLKTLISIVAVLLMIWGVIWLLGRVKNGSDKTTNGFEAIPVNAAYIFQSDNLEELFNRLSESHVWSNLSELPGLTKMQALLQRLDSLSTENNQLAGMLSDASFKASAHVTNQKSPDFLLSFLFKEMPSETRFEHFIIELFSGAPDIKNPRKYEGYAIKTLEGIMLPGFDKQISYTFHDNMLLMSFSDILLENAIRQIKLNENLVHNPAFKELVRTAGKNVPANLFINHKELPAYFSIYSRAMSTSKAGFFQSFSDWSVLDLKIKDDVLLFSGFTNQNDSLNHYLSIFSSQQPQRMQIQSLAPSNTRCFISLCFEDMESLWANYKLYRELYGSGTSLSSKTSELSSKMGLNLREEVIPLVANEAGLLFTAFSQQNYDENIFGVLEIKSTTAFRSLILKAIDHIASTKGNNKNKYLSSISIDQATRYEIFYLPDNQLMSALFGDMFASHQNNYFAFVGDYLVSANNKTALSKFIHFHVLGKTLESDVQYQNLSQYFSTQANITLYSNIPNAVDVYSSFLSDKMVDLLRNNESVFNKVRGLGIQYHFSGEYFFNTMYLKYLDNYTESAHTVWETLLDTTIWFKPTFVKNHYTNENEIFVQDNANNIYLINKIGRVLWKLVLNEPIIGNVYQIDYYKNEKLQLLFATSSKIHLIDRNGNYVEHYPINLRSETRAGLSLFDYDKNLDYRIFVPTTDKHIYAYSSDGKLVDGWEFDKTERVLTQPVQHFRIGEKDYIVARDTYKTYILNRRGQIRVPVKQLIPFSENNVFHLSSGNAARAKIATTDTTGKVYFVYFDGTIEEKTPGRFHAGHYFLFEDVNGDYQKDLIFLDKNILSVFGQNGKEIFTYKLKNDAAFSPIYFDFGLTDKKIGLVETQSGEIYLINNDGSLYDGFPLTGTTPFSIGRLAETSRFNLIVGNSDNFLLNYSVQ